MIPSGGSWNWPSIKHKQGGPKNGPSRRVQKWPPEIDHKYLFDKNNQYRIFSHFNHPKHWLSPALRCMSASGITAYTRTRPNCRPCSKRKRRNLFVTLRVHCLSSTSPDGCHIMRQILGVSLHASATNCSLPGATPFLFGQAAMCIAAFQL